MTVTELLRRRPRAARIIGTAWIGLGCALVLAAGNSAALSVTTGFEGGAQMTLNSTMLGCESAGTAGQLSCTGSSLTSGDGAWTIQNWNMFADPDPTIQNSFSVVNNTASTQSFFFSVSLPVSITFGPPSLIRGSVGGSATDLGGNGVVLGSTGASPIYDALIDGVSVRTLLDAPQSFTNPAAFGTAGLSVSEFGIPVQESIAFGTTTSIGLTIRFDLSAGDSAALTSVFDVQPVPEPGTALLMGIGLIGLAANRPRSN